jgi:Flp pilus assembly protein TadG
MIMNKRRPIAANRVRGVAAVEFALVVPFLATMILGIIEGGRLTAEYQAIDVCARAGAREAALSTSTAASTVAAATNCLAAAGVSGVAPTLLPADPSTVAVGSQVSVSISVPFSRLSWIGVMFQTQNVTVTCTMCKQD